MTSDNIFGSGSFPECPNLLLVDDNINHLTILKEALEENGYNIQVALDGKKAIELATIKPPHLIILDVMMPGMDGMETCRQLKQHADLRYIPVIFLTAKNDSEGLTQFYHSSAADYLTKPFDIDELQHCVNTHLNTYFRSLPDF